MAFSPVGNRTWDLGHYEAVAAYYDLRLDFSPDFSCLDLFSENEKKKLCDKKDMSKKTNLKMTCFFKHCFLIHFVKKLLRPSF